MAGAPLDLRVLFARPWEGEARWWRPWWLRWLPMPDRWAFRSEIVAPSDAGWDVVDTTTWPDGRVQTRTMRCVPIDGGRLRLTAADMPGGAEVIPRSDGFDFTPYVIRAPVLGPLSVALCVTDRVRLGRDGTMVDEIELRCVGVCVGRIVMRLRRLEG